MHTILYLEVETLGEIICIYNILYTAAAVMMRVIPLFMQRVPITEKIHFNLDHSIHLMAPRWKKSLKWDNKGL